MGECDLHHGDCLDVMPRLASASVDLVLADLPYGTTRCKWDAVIPFAPLWAEYERILRPTGCVVLHAAQPFTSALVMSNPKWFRYDLVWDKVAITGHLDAKRKPLRRHESLLIFSPVARHTCNPQMTTGRRHVRCAAGRATECYGSQDNRPAATVSDQFYPTSIITISSGRKRLGQHPTAKPVALAEYLIRTYSNPGDLVVDNVMGSGTTGLAAIKTGRRFVGIERDANYFATAVQRIRGHG